MSISYKEIFAVVYYFVNQLLAKSNQTCFVKFQVV